MTEEQFKDILKTCKTGQRVTCEIRETKIDDAKLYMVQNQKEEEFYICHNKGSRDGNSAPDGLGYPYSWVVKETTLSSIYNFVLIPEKTAKSKPTWTINKTAIRSDGLKVGADKITLPNGVGFEVDSAKEEVRLLRAGLEMHKKL